MRSLHFAVIGGGSIGTRHAKNLITLGQQVRIIESYPPQADILTTQGFTVYTDIADAFTAEVDAVLICSPTVLHFEHLQAAIAHSKHVFVEKPIAQTLDGVQTLIDDATQKKLISLVGFNMRFRDGFKRAQQMVIDGKIGKPLAARANVSYYLPHYHPDKDYRQRYQAQKKLGGGVVLDDIHELDYLTVLFGKVKEVFAYVETLSDLEIDVEDYAGVMMKHESGVITQLQMDFLQHVYHRKLEITGSQATLTLDHNTGEIRQYGNADHQFHVFPQRMGVTVNQMYLDEMAHFVRCLQGEEPPIADLTVGRDVLQLALAIFESASKKQLVYLD